MVRNVFSWFVLRSSLMICKDHLVGSALLFYEFMRNVEGIATTKLELYMRYLLNSGRQQPDCTIH